MEYYENLENLENVEDLEKIKKSSKSLNPKKHLEKDNRAKNIVDAKELVEGEFEKNIRPRTKFFMV